MEQAYHFLALSGAFTLLMWVPYILSRLFIWGIGDFLKNYPDGYPAQEPTPPLWAQRAKRAHLNMVETLPAFVAVVVAAGTLSDGVEAAFVGQCAMVFFYARVVHYVVYALGVPYLRTPAYLVSWAAILAIGFRLA